MIKLNIIDQLISISKSIDGYILKLRKGSYQQLMQSLLENATFLPMYGMTEQQKLEHRAIFANISIDNYRNVGTVIGMSILGLLGFLALGFTIIGGIGGGILGLALGRYLGRKLSKSITTKGVTITEFEVFVLRMKCIIKWCRLSVDLFPFDVNYQRFTVQRLLTEIKPLLHYKYFGTQYQKQSKHLINKIQQLISQEKCLIPICITYKLTKEYIRIIENKIIYSKFSSEQILILLQETIADVLRPFYTLFKGSQIEKKNHLIRTLLYKINNLIIHPVVVQSQEIYVDQELTISHIREFSAKLSQKIRIDDLERYLRDQYFNTLKQNQSIQPSIQPPIPQFRRRKSVGDASSASYKIEEEQQAQLPLIWTARRVRARSYDDKKGTVVVQLIDEISKSKEQVEIPIKEDSVRQSSEIQSQKIAKSNKRSSLFGSQIQIQIQKSQNIQLSSELEQKFKLLIDLIEEPVDQWEVVLKKEHLVIYRTFKPGNPAVFVKGHADLINVPKSVLVKAICHEEYRKKWDKILVNFHVVEKESDEVDVIYYYVQSPLGVANREFCQKRITKQDFPNKGQIALIYFSVDNMHAPIVKGHVRAETLISGYVIEDIPTGCRLNFISNNDVKGQIPRSLVNYVASRAPVSWINSLRQGCLDHDKIMAQLEKDRLKKRN